MILDARTIARALDGEISGRQVLAPGPGHSRIDRSLSIRVEPSAPDGFLCHSFAGDDPIVCKNHVRQRLGLPEWTLGDERDRRVDASRRAQFDRAEIHREATKRPRSEDDHHRIERAVAIWNEGDDPRGTLAETYLNVHRKLALDDDLAGSVLRFHPRCPWRNESSGKTDRVPALIAAFRSIDDGTITAVHRIALNSDGTKLDRRMLGVVHRAAVMLDPIGAELAIGEGVETCGAPTRYSTDMGARLDRKHRRLSAPRGCRATAHPRRDRRSKPRRNSLLWSEMAKGRPARAHRQA
jgi:hypothetical protein